MQDILEKRQYPLATRDAKGNLRVAAAVGPFDFSRAELLDQNSVDALVVDCAHGHNMKVVHAVKDIKGSMKAEVIAGNIATSAAAEALAGAGVDGIKVGIGPGSICTTRIVAGYRRSPDHRNCTGCRHRRTADSRSLRMAVCGSAAMWQKRLPQGRTLS